MLEALSSAVAATALAEWVAVLCALLYLIFAIRRQIICWVFAFISTGIYTVLFFDVRLLMESALNAYYLAMAVYGFLQWRQFGSGGTLASVQLYPVSYHAVAIAGILAVSALAGSFLDRFTSAAMPYIDSMTTFGALFATWLVARREIMNWYYWLVIDLLSVYLYWRAGLALSALLFVIYLCMIPVGIVSWNRVWRSQRRNISPSREPV